MANKGILGDMFDLNKDGQIDESEKAAERQFLEEMEKSNVIIKANTDGKAVEGLHSQNKGYDKNGDDYHFSGSMERPEYDED